MSENTCGTTLFADLPDDLKGRPYILSIQVERETKIDGADPNQNDDEFFPLNLLTSIDKDSVLGTPLSQVLFGGKSAISSQQQEEKEGDEDGEHPTSTTAAPEKSSIVSSRLPPTHQLLPTAGFVELGGWVVDLTNQRKSSDYEEYEFSLERGFLLIGSEARRSLNLTRYNATLARNNECLGGPFTRQLLKEFLGYETVVLNAVIQHFGGRGYVHALQTGNIYNLNYVTEIDRASSDFVEAIVFEVSIFVTSVFIWFACTSLVAMTFRETQVRLVLFTLAIQQHTNRGLPLRQLLIAHLSHSLLFILIMIGVLLCISEFLGDRLLALLVLSLVWTTEPFSLIVLRTSSSLRLFPRFFFAYLLAFHIYFFSFPFGYNYFALFVLASFVSHLMLRFLNENLAATFAE